jgi:hypothetical protein
MLLHALSHYTTPNRTLCDIFRGLLLLQERHIIQLLLHETVCARVADVYMYEAEAERAAWAYQLDLLRVDRIQYVMVLKVCTCINTCTLRTRDTTSASIGITNARARQ